MQDAAESNSSGLSRALKWGGGVVGGLVVLVLAVALLLPQLFSSEQLKSYVIPPIEEATGRQVEIGDIGLRVLPQPAVNVTDFALSNAEGFGTEPAVSGRAFRVNVALWPLFTGSIEPTAIELVEPVIRYQVAEDGGTNFDDLGGTTDTTQTDEGGGLAIPVSNFRMTDAAVVYTDAATGQSIDLGFDAQLNALPEDGGALTSEGTFDVASLTAVLPGEESGAASDTVALTSAQLRYDVRAALNEGRIELRSLRLQTAPLTLDLSGTVADLNAARPRVDLTLETGETNLADLSDLVPAAAVDGLNPSGTLQMKTAVRGLLPDSTGSLDSLSVDGSGTLAGLGVDYQGSALLRDLNADLSISIDSMAVRSIRGQLLGKPLEGYLAVANPMDRPTVDGRLAGAANLAELSSLTASGTEASGEAAADVAGNAEYDVRFAGPIDTPDAIRPRGQIRLTDVRYPTPSLRGPLQISSATVQLTGTGLSMDRFTMTSGDQQMAVRATVQRLFPLSKGLAETNPAMAVDFTFTSDRLDLIELFPETDTSEVYYSQLFAAELAGSKVKGQDPEVLAEELYGDVELPAFAMDGRVEIGTLLNEPQRYDDLTMNLTMRNRRLEVRDLTAQTYGGQLAGSITFDQSGSASASANAPREESVLMAAGGTGTAVVAPRSSPRPAGESGLTYDLEITDAKAGALLSDWTTLGRFVNGSLDLDVGGDSPLSTGLLPLADALTADGASIVANGGLSLDLGAVQALVGKLGLAKTSFTEFKRFGGPFTIDDGSLRMGEWTLGGSGMTATLSGALGLGGAVDVQMRTDLPISRLRNSKILSFLNDSDGLSKLVDRLAGGSSQDQTVPVQIRIGGTMGEPEVDVVNRDAIRSGIRQLAKDAGLNRLRNLFDGGN